MLLTAPPLLGALQRQAERRGLTSSLARSARPAQSRPAQSRRSETRVTTAGIPVIGPLVSSPLVVIPWALEFKRAVL